MASGSLKAILYALGANTGIAIAKTIAALATNSGSMIAEAIHSYADCANQGLLLLGMKQAKRPETDDHPLGHGRVVYFWSLIVALMLFFVGGAFSVYEGIERLRHPHPLEHALAAMLVLTIAIGLESFSLWGALTALKPERGSQTLMQWARTTRQSELLVVTGEDIAALGGLIMALLGIGLTWLTGNLLFDALGSIGIGILLMLVAIFILVKTKSMMVGESVSPELRHEIETFVAAQAEVEKVFRVITLAWGEQMVIAVKAKMKSGYTADEMVDAINVVEARMQEKWTNAKWVFFEPDVK